MRASISPRSTWAIDSLTSPRRRLAHDLGAAVGVELGDLLEVDASAHK